MKPYPNVFNRLNDAVHEARNNDAASIAKLTNTILDSISLADIPSAHSLRGRIARAEHAYRRGQQPPILERDLADAMNQVADLAGAPSWARTSVAQLHLFRTILKPHVPPLVGRRMATGKGPYAISDEMSPAEAVFVALFLANSKMTNVAYQVDPDEWVEKIREAKLHISPAPSSSSIDAPAKGVGHEDSQEIFRAMRGLEHDLKTESSSTSSLVHAFLDRINITR